MKLGDRIACSCVAERWPRIGWRPMQHAGETAVPYATALAAGERAGVYIVNDPAFGRDLAYACVDAVSEQQMADWCESVGLIYEEIG